MHTHTTTHLNAIFQQRQPLCFPPPTNPISCKTLKTTSGLKLAVAVPGAGDGAGIVAVSGLGAGNGRLGGGGWGSLFLPEGMAAAEWVRD
jgi:hypothetical protein